MATKNSTGNSLTGATGTGTFVGATSPTLVTPTLGAATATSVTFSPSTGGIVGTTTNNNAGSGYVGEYISSTIAAPGNSITNSTQTNLTSISLPAGDWDVEGCGGILGANTSLSLVIGSISTTSATQADFSLQAYISPPTGIGAGAGPVPSQRLSLSSTTTVYLVLYAVFTSTATMTGVLSARRVR